MWVGSGIMGRLGSRGVLGGDAPEWVGGCWVLKSGGSASVYPQNLECCASDRKLIFP